MASGIWVVLGIPALVAFIFGAWVLYNIIVDVSTREPSPFTAVGPDTIRVQIKSGS